MDKKKKILIIIAVIVGLALIASIAYLIYQNRSLKNELSQEEITTVTPVPSPTVTKTASKIATKTPTPTPEPSSKSDEELIKEALSEKLSTDSSNLTVSITKKTSEAAFGTVGIEGEMGGGWFVAVKEGDHWKIIADGNGVIECAILDQYNVPSSVVGECYDSATGESRTR